jgi:hypothetical protein
MEYVERMADMQYGLLEFIGKFRKQGVYQKDIGAQLISGKKFELKQIHHTLTKFSREGLM